MLGLHRQFSRRIGSDQGRPFITGLSKGSLVSIKLGESGLAIRSFDNNSKDYFSPIFFCFFLLISCSLG